MLVLNLESCVLSNYERQSTTKAREPQGGKGKIVNFLLNSFLCSLVHTEALQCLQQVEDEHVGAKLEAELWERCSHSLTQLEVIPAW